MSLIRSPASAISRDLTITDIWAEWPFPCLGSLNQWGPTHSGSTSLGDELVIYPNKKEEKEKEEKEEEEDEEEEEEERRRGGGEEEEEDKEGREGRRKGKKREGKKREGWRVGGRKAGRESKQSSKMWMNFLVTVFRCLGSKLRDKGRHGVVLFCIYSDWLIDSFIHSFSFFLLLLPFLLNKASLKPCLKFTILLLPQFYAYEMGSHAQFCLFLRLFFCFPHLGDQ